MENVGFKWETKSETQQTICDKNTTCLQEFRPQGGHKEGLNNYPKKSYLRSCADKPRLLLYPLKAWKRDYLTTKRVKKTVKAGSQQVLGNYGKNAKYTRNGLPIVKQQVPTIIA